MIKQSWLFNQFTSKKEPLIYIQHYNVILYSPVCAYLITSKINLITIELQAQLHHICTVHPHENNNYGTIHKRIIHLRDILCLMMQTLNLSLSRSLWMLYTHITQMLHGILQCVLCVSFHSEQNVCFVKSKLTKHCFHCHTDHIGLVNVLAGACTLLLYVKYNQHRRHNWLMIT